MLPNLTLNDERNESLINLILIGEVAKAENSPLVVFSNIAHSIIGQFRAMVIFSSNLLSTFLELRENSSSQFSVLWEISPMPCATSGKSGSGGMAVVVRNRNPFKIFRSIVGWISILMVTNKPIGSRANECLSYKAMNPVEISDTINAEMNLPVTLVPTPKAWFYQSTGATWATSGTLGITSYLSSIGNAISSFKSNYGEPFYVHA